MTMRFKYFFLGLMLLIVVGSIAAASADEDYSSLGDYTFDIPEGYQIVDESDNMLNMEADDDHAIIVYLLDTPDDLGLFNSLLESQGCKFNEVDDFQSGSFDVNVRSYEYQDIQGILYTCDDGSGTPILVASAVSLSDDGPDVDNDTARQVVESLE